MKHLTKLFIALFAVAFLVSCSSDSESTSVDASEAQEVAETTDAAKSYTVDLGMSSVEWTGQKKFVEWGHSGTITLTSGTLNVEGENITSGNFSLDMNSILESDPADEEKSAELIGHLMSADFFETETFPTADFEITKVEASTDGEGTHSVSGNLTIKGTTKNISFPATIAMEENGVNVTAAFNINRADFNVQYGSKSFFDELLDKNVIDDEMGFKVNLSAGPVM